MTFGVYRSRPCFGGGDTISEDRTLSILAVEGLKHGFQLLKKPLPKEQILLVRAKKGFFFHFLRVLKQIVDGS